MDWKRAKKECQALADETGRDAYIITGDKHWVYQVIGSRAFHDRWPDAKNKPIVYGKRSPRQYLKGDQWDGVERRVSGQRDRREE